jgi:Carboxypeptidase regulatory-like domain/TonB dependent receptor
MKTFSFFLRIVLFVCLSAMAWSQALTQIQGNVQDSTGAAVPGAAIKATQTSTGVTRTTTSAADGGYVLSNLPLGPYSLEVTKDGFQKFVQTGITLQVNVAPTVDIALKVGSVSESVQVEANAALVETQSTGIGQVMETQRILELPLNGRNAADLIQLTTGSVQMGVSSSRSFQGSSGGEAIAVAGGQPWSTTYLLDGTLHNNSFDNLNLPLPFPDALQEFKVETSSLTAQNGVHSGAAVNAVTKGGTNQIHGDLFEFFRNGALNGKNVFATTPDVLKRNQFGGTIGGPIKKDKLFFFGGYQGARIRNSLPASPAFVPTAKMLAGDFTDYASAACQGSQKTLKGPFLNNIATQALDAPAVAVAKLLPTPINACGQVNYSVPIAQNEYQIVVRSDYQLSDKQSLFGRYIATSFNQAVPYSLVPNNLLLTATGGRDNLGQSITLGDTYIVNSTQVNALRLAFNRTAIHRTNAPDFGPSDIGLKNVYSYQPDYMLLTDTGLFSIGGGTENFATFRTSEYQLTDDYSWSRGRHSYVFGWDLAMWRSNGYAQVRSPGQYTFGSTVTGLGLTDFLMGDLQSLLQAAPNTLLMSEWYTGAYAQDTWKITPRLTFNYGLRWEPYLPQNIRNGYVYSFDYSRFLANKGSTVYVNAPAGFTYPGDPGFIGNSGVNANWKNFAPRVGLAWDPKGDGRMTIRASWGMAYDYVNGQFNINTSIAPPFGQQTTVTPGTTYSFDNPWATFPGGNPFPVNLNKNITFATGGTFLVNSPNMPNTQVNSWNLTVQKQFGTSWLFSASYIGNEAAHLWGLITGNPVQYIPGTCAAGQYGLTAAGPCSSTTTANYLARRQFTSINPTAGQYIGPLDYYDTGLTSSYQGMTTSIQRRLSNGFTGQANYTWSHCLSTDRQNYGGGTPNAGNGLLFPNNAAADKGNCLFDRRQIFNATVVYQVPKFANKTLRVAASGWQVAGIFRAASGLPLAITTGTDASLTGQCNGPITGCIERPNQIAGNVYAPVGTGSLQYLDPTAFAQPSTGTFGNMSPGSVISPGFTEIDMAISRTFALHERYKLDIRGEAFNVPNSFRAGCPAGSSTCAGVQFIGQSLATAATFGKVTNAMDPRIIQFSMKLVF